MSTSLAEQLQKLKKPQTNLLLQGKKRVSLLFNPKEAANLDRETVFNIGYNGLEDLIKLSSAFEEFESSLFASSSIGIERSIHDVHINKKIDGIIEKFLIILSPYFLLNSAHKALEWLVYRFHIHEFNKDQFLMLILPYHETRMFVRALQIVDLTNARDKWHWLEPLQKPGVPLSSMTLVNRVAHDNGLLKLLCTHVVSATDTIIETYDRDQGSAGALSSLYAFYTIAIVGIIERGPKITEVQVDHLLPTISKGVSSSIVDFATSNCMILAKLSCHIQLNNDRIEHILSKALKNPHLKNQVMLLIIFLYESSYNQQFAATVSPKLLSKISKLSSSWICNEMNRLQKSMQINVSKLLIPLFDSAINYIFCNTDDDYDQLQVDRIKIMMVEILKQVFIQDCDIDRILNDIFKRTSAVKKLSTVAKDFIVELYNTIELKYPERFDNYMKTLMKQSETNAEIKKKLELLISCRHRGVKNFEVLFNILDGLNHYSAEQRIIALEVLSKNVNIIMDSIPESFKVMLKDALLERLNDDDVRVGKVLLERFSTKCLESLFPINILVNKLMMFLSRFYATDRHELAQPALKLLLQLYDVDICQDSENKSTDIFIATLPYLFPNCDDEVEMTMYILESEFTRKNKYLAAVKNDVIGLQDSMRNPECIGTVSFHNILNWQLLPSIDKILNVMKLSYNNIHGNSDARSWFFNLLLLGSACRVSVGSLQPKVARDVIQMAAKVMKYYPKVRSMEKCNQLNDSKIQDALQLTSKGILPIQAGTYVLEMVHRRLNLQSNFTLDFENNYDHAQLIVELLDILFDGMASSKLQAHYSWCLKIFFQRHCPTSRDMLRFLAQFFLEPVKAQISLHCLKIVLAILQNECNTEIGTKNLMGWIFQDEIFIMNLLVALSRVNKECRDTALEILTQITSTFIHSASGCSRLFSKLREKSIDISIDAEQLGVTLYMLLSPDPDVQCQLKKDESDELEKAREFFMNIILNDKIPIHPRSQLLEVLSLVNGPKIVEQLTRKIGCRLLDELSNSNDNQQPSNKIFAKMFLKNILERFNSTTVEVLMVKEVWQFFNSAMNNHNMEIPIKNSEGKVTRTQVSPSVILLQQIDNVFFENCEKLSNLQGKILTKLVDIVTYCKIPTVVAAAKKTAKRLIFDARVVIDELRKMSNGVKTAVESTKKIKQLEVEQEQSEKMSLINQRDWERGVTILEFIQSFENIKNEELLIKVLFNILRVCLVEHNAEMSPSVDYVNQLILSLIHQFAIENLPIPDPHKKIELISQCIKTSHNPQTHHHALVVLVELFKVTPVDLALHNIMPIFTFMGNSVLRQDDAYSIQIISKIIETIVPTIVDVNNEIHACTLLRTFIVSLPDIPEHRRVPLFVKLLKLMENNLSLFYLILFEYHAHVIQKNCEKDLGMSSPSSPSLKPLEFVLTISQEFTPDVLIQVCIKLLEFLRNLPVEIDENNRKKYSSDKKYIFDVTNKSSKELRYYRYTIVEFLCSLVSNSDFINRVDALSVPETKRMITHYNDLLIQLIMMIESVTKCTDVCKGKLKMKYWKVLLNILYNILNGINELLPNDAFIMTIKKLIKPKQMMMMVRRKAIELMNLRLQQRKFGEEDRDSLLKLINPLLAIVLNDSDENGKESMVNQEREIIQQTSVITLKLLAKNWANEYPEKFQPVLAGLTTMLNELSNGPLLGSVVLGIAELCATMRTHAIKYINQFVPAIIKLLRSHCNNSVSISSSSSSSIFITSTVTALQKIVESMGNFLSLYLDELILELCRLSCLYNPDNANDNEKSVKTGPLIVRIQTTSSKLSSCIPMRVLIPTVEKIYNKLMEQKLYHCIKPLMGILSESFNHITAHDIEMAIGDIGQLFLKILQFRELMMVESSNKNLEQVKNNSDNNYNNKNIIIEIEDCVGKAVVSLVLKLSEATFRPFYYKLYDWAARSDGEHKERNITFFRLSYSIAECLKSLFVLFANHFLNHAALLLSHNMTNMNEQHMQEEEDVEYRLELESSRIELTDILLMTFEKLLGYDSSHYVNKDRFEILSKPIIDQIENIMGNVEDHERRGRELIIPCVGTFVSAIQDDSLHKQVVYQILLKTRHDISHVRKVGLGALLEIARKLGEDFMPLLSETIPFIAEMLEDENEDIEKAAQNAVRTLEEILGEPLQKYF